MDNNIFDENISVFDSLTSYKNPKMSKVSDSLIRFCGDEFEDTIKRLRASEDGEEIDRIKRVELETFAFHAVFNGRRTESNISHMTGIIILDIDDVNVDDINDIKERIVSESNSVLAAMTSPSGDGIKVLYCVDSEMVTKDNYRKIGKKISKKFSDFGKIDVLSLTDCLIATFDPNIVVNDNVVADCYVKLDDDYAPSSSAELPERDFSIPLWEDAEEFYERVLLSKIQENADNNFHFIQMSVFELAKFGMVQGHSLEFILDYVPKKSVENNKRLYGAIEKSVDIKQTHWAYDYTSDDSFELRGTSGIKGSSSGSSNADSDEDEEPSVIMGRSIFLDALSAAKEGNRVGCEISLSNFADIFRWKTGVTVITGIPSHGKTEFLDQNVIDLYRLHGWKTAVAGFEQSYAEHYVKMSRKVAGFDFRINGADMSEFENIHNFVADGIFHVNVEKTGGNIDKILNVFEELHRSNGVKNFVIDPFNLLSVSGKLNGNEKVEEILRRIVTFAKRLDVSVMLVAHPTKMKKDESGQFEIPDMYSIKGSSAFYEMCYHGLVVYRDDKGKRVIVRVLKVKQNNLGVRGGEAYFSYDQGSGRYKPLSADGEPLNLGDENEKYWHKKGGKNGNVR